MKPLLLISIVVLGLLVLLPQGWTDNQEAQLETADAQVNQLQQQNETLMTEQEQLQSEKGDLLLQNQQMHQDLAELEAAYEHLNAQNQTLQAEFAAAAWVADMNLTIAFVAGLVIFLAMSAVSVTAFAIARGTRLTQPQPSANLPEQSKTDELGYDRWASRRYRDQAIQKARLLERWERQSLLAFQKSRLASAVSKQRRMEREMA